MSAPGQTKKFGKGERTVPTQKAQKWYSVDDEPQPKKVSIPASTPYCSCFADARGAAERENLLFW